MARHGIYLKSEKVFDLMFWLYLKRLGLSSSPLLEAETLGEIVKKKQNRK